MNCLCNNVKKEKENRLFIILVGIIVICFFVYAKCTIDWGWCSDDAYHAYTMAKNLINCQGFTPTVGKRVNVSICPLWTLIISIGMFFYRDEYYLGMGLNLLFTWFAFLLLCIQIVNEARKNVDEKRYIFYLLYMLLATYTLCCSKAFISYTTSGLENSLLFFLSSLFITYFIRVYKKKNIFDNKSMFCLAFIEGLIIFTRMDAGLIFLPLCIFAGVRLDNGIDSAWMGRIISWLQRIVFAVLGIIPFIVWELFSVFYYGSFVPNTALAKLNTGFPQYQYYERGIVYYIKTLEWDCIVIMVPVVLIVLSSIFMIKKYTDRYIIYFLASIGIMVYMIYILKIGGDFMKGRHFTVIFWFAINTFFS